MMSPKKAKKIRRGQVYFAEIDGTAGAEQGGSRPVIIVQNDVGNYFSPTTVVAMLSCSTQKARLPTHVVVEIMHKKGDILPNKSLAMLEQIRTIDKERLVNLIGSVCKNTMKQVDDALMCSVGLTGS